MKKLLIVLFMAIGTTMSAQNQPQNTISVGGEGKVMVKPDEALLSIGVETNNPDAKVAKSENDAVMAKMIDFLKKSGIDAKDYKTERVNLYQRQDYESKEKYYQAGQTIQVHIKDLSKYETIMAGMIDAGANQINGIQFKSSQMEKYESEARKKAVQNAQKKAQDYAQALGQNVGTAIVVSENGAQAVFPRMYQMKAAAYAESDTAAQTLAEGEIEITANVNITFQLK
ncbi:MAG TPA: SIMPL domain-containing protein [Flavobacterium sp.]|nr:SIMPL domain-containing protein [Flavobacterium sp.]